MNSPDPNQNNARAGRSRLSLLERLRASPDQLERLARDLLQGAHVEGGRLHAAGVEGGAGRSLNVELAGDRAGLWRDAATDEGGDLVGLAARTWRIPTDRIGAELERRGYLPAAARSHQRSHPPAPDDLPPPDAPPAGLRIRAGVGGALLDASSVWRYQLGDGRPAFDVLRYDLPGGGKEIRPARWRRGRWEPGAVPAPRPLYRLPDLTTRPDAPALVVEGEKAADRAASLFPDCAATTSAGGSSAAAKSDWAALAGRDVLIIPDLDEAGDRYAGKVASLCAAAGAGAVRIAPAAEVARLLGVEGDLPAGWDVGDAPADAGPIALPDLLAVAGDAPPPAPVGGPIAAGGWDGVFDAQSSIGDAARLMLALGDRVLLARSDNGDPSEVFISGDAGVWLHDLDALGAAHSTAAQSLAVAAQASAASGTGSVAESNSALKWTLRTQSPRGLSDALQSCGAALGRLRAGDPASLAAVRSVEAAELDDDARYVGAPNGVVDLHTGGLLVGAEARGKLVTRSLPDPFVPDATHPLIDRLLEHQNAAESAWLLTGLGLALRGALGTYVLVIWGATGGGKSTLISALAAALGRYAVPLNAGTFADPTRGRAGAPSPDLELLRGRRLAYASEAAALSSDREWLKRLTGGEPLSSRRMRQDHEQSFVNRSLILLTGNDLPRVGAHDAAILRRLIVARWAAIPPDEQDRGMLDEVKRDAQARQAMVALLVRAALGWDVDTWLLEQPASIAEAIAEAEAVDTPGALAWARDAVVRGVADDVLTGAMLWGGARAACPDGDGVEGYGSQRSFTRRVREDLDLPPPKTERIGAKTVSGWRGWRLRSPDDPASDDPAGQASLDAGGAGGDAHTCADCGAALLFGPDGDYCGACAGGGAQ